MKIAVGNDHAGWDEPKPYYKPAVLEHLKELGHEVIDCGSREPGSVDYPDFAQKVADAVLSGEAQMGVLLCGSGIGVSIAANRNKGIRAANCVRPEMAYAAREHNDANILCLGTRLLSIRECANLIDIFFSTPFSKVDRHQRRVDKMN